MDEWIRRYAGALGVELTPEDARRLLDLASAVAHGTERKNAPLATYLVGRFAGGAMGEELARALAEARERAEALLPAPSGAE